jgi:hypothetical protein
LGPFSMMSMVVYEKFSCSSTYVSFHSAKIRRTFEKTIMLSSSAMSSAITPSSPGCSTDGSGSGAEKIACMQPVLESSPLMVVGPAHMTAIHGSSTQRVSQLLSQV